MIEVACAVIVRDDGKVLVTQRSAEMKLPLKMEFPGGKIEPGETARDCIIREVFEELGVAIIPVSQLAINEHQYADFSIRLIPFVCRITSGTVVLKEHAAYSWLQTNELIDLDWAAADIPVVRNYLSSIK
ncbi:(deoxy)nucleoside triphosphate pyrophosphohydrolase [Pedobacter nyackensis]|uniref:(deoxy)nucleoside triphosphate pyrophosphohydrolase n=1 Tax=Pedobacter nyackensis TaxID=475255 RepID=UPI0029311F38|nr:(deoxy)nucleoside triphosphate pyrophosphohydrolase [Pedobacter nyackensis]